MGRSLLWALSPGPGGNSALGVLSLCLPLLQPLAHMGPSGLGSGRHLVFLSLVTALSSPHPTLAASASVTTFLMRLPRAPLGQIPLQASQQLRGWAGLRVRLGRGRLSPSPACRDTEAIQAPEPVGAGRWGRRAWEAGRPTPASIFSPAVTVCSNNTPSGRQIGLQAYCVPGLK